MYNPLEDAYRRRQPQPDVQPIAVQQPQAVIPQQAPTGPAPMQWQPMGDQGQQGNQFGGLGDLLKRFAKPKGASGDSSASDRGAYEAM